MKLVYALLAVAWFVFAVLQRFEAVEPIKGTTHAESFFACLALGMLNLILSYVIDGNERSA